MTHFGVWECKALELISAFQPDLIALMGDLISLGKGVKSTEEFLKALREVATVFAVEGNSEVVNGISNHFAKFVERLGGYWLHNEAVQFRKGIWFAGTADPNWHRDDVTKTLREVPE